MIYGIGLLGNRAHQMSYGPILAARDDCKIVAAAEHNAEKAKPLEQKFGVTCVEDYDAVLENTDVDIVSIATDFYLKRSLIQKAVACGKHVLVDKPMGRTVAEVQAMVEAARGSGVKIVVSYPIRYVPGLAKFAADVRAGMFKKITAYTHHFIRQFPDSDLMQYVSYPTAPRLNGGGELMNLGSHAVDFMHHLFGMPRRVFCHMENAYWEEYKQFGTEDMSTLVCEYEGFVATVVTGRSKVKQVAPSLNILDLVCEGVWVHADAETCQHNGEPVEVPQPRLGHSESCVQELIDCIEQDREPVMGLSDGLAVAQITTACYQSSERGTFVDLPLKDDKHPLIPKTDQVIDGLLD
ncbi:MAG: Gfo/Idh/MocA family oxidoreductase [bacterium]|nr:Gfo/Idh/MocA family oxidoreductase [bacterium]